MRLREWRSSGWEGGGVVDQGVRLNDLLASYNGSMEVCWTAD